MKQVVAHARKKKQAQAVVKQHAQVLSKEEQVQYNNFWGGVEASMLLQNHQLRHAAEKKEENKDNADTILLSKGLIDPGNMYKIIWDVFLGVPIMYSVIMVPYTLAFNVQSTRASAVVDYVMNALFCLDIVINFNTSYYDSKTDKTIRNRMVVAKEYMKFWFWADLVTSLPLEDIVEASALHSGGHLNSVKLLRVTRATRIIRLMKLLRILKLSRLSVHLEKLNINPQIMSVINLIVQIMVIAHLVACFWFLLSTSFPASYPTWVNQYVGFDGNTLVGMPVTDLYVASLYWTVFSMLSVGYGDVHPWNSMERLYALFVMLFGGILFGAVIAQVTRFIESRNPQARTFKLRLAELKSYLSEKTLTTKLHARTIEAYTYSLLRKSTFSESGGLFDVLPRAMLIKLAKSIYEKEISKIELFQTADIAFVVQLVVNSNPLQVLTGEVIYECGDVAEDMMFIMSGIVKITTRVGYRQVVAGYANEGGFVGDFEYLSKSTRVATYTAMKVCSLLSVGDQALEDAMTDHYDAGKLFEAEMKRRFALFKDALKSGIKLHEKETAAMRRKKAAQSKGPAQQTGGSQRWLADRAASMSQQLTPTLSRKSSRNLLHLVPRLHMGLSQQNMGVHGDGADVATDTLRPEKEAKEAVLHKQASVSVRTLIHSKSFHDMVSELSSKRGHELPACRSMLWVDGVLVSATENERDLDTHLSHESIYRVLVLNKDRQEVIVEEPVSAMTARLIMHPRGSRKNVWDLLIGALIIYSIIWIPVELGFSVEPSFSFLWFENVVDILFGLDILYCLRTAYFDDEKDAYVAVPGRIFRNYMKTWFLVDFMSCVPFDTIATAVIGSESSQGLKSISVVKTIRLTRLLKLARLMKLTKYLTRLENDFGIPPAVFDLLKMICEVFFIAHMVACIYWLMCSKQIHHKWYQYASGVDYETQSLRDQYILSLYWTVTTLTTTGYGDIGAVTSYERILDIFVMIIGASVFGYIVANVSALMGSMNQTQVQKREKLAEITEFLKEKQIPKALQGTIIRHFKYMFMKASVFNEDVIMGRLPRSISIQILLAQYADVMEKIPLFKFIENRNQALYIFKCMSSVYFDRNHVLIREGEMASEIFFIVGGRARVYKRIRRQQDDEVPAYDNVIEEKQRQEEEGRQLEALRQERRRKAMERFSNAKHTINLLGNLAIKHSRVHPIVGDVADGAVPSEEEGDAPHGPSSAPPHNSLSFSSVSFMSIRSNQSNSEVGNEVAGESERPVWLERPVSGLASGDGAWTRSDGGIGSSSNNNNSDNNSDREGAGPENNVELFQQAGEPSSLAQRGGDNRWASLRNSADIKTSSIPTHAARGGLTPAAAAAAAAATTAAALASSYVESSPSSSSSLHRKKPGTARTASKLPPATPPMASMPQSSPEKRNPGVSLSQPSSKSSGRPKTSTNQALDHKLELDGAQHEEEIVHAPGASDLHVRMANSKFYGERGRIYLGEVGEGNFVGHAALLRQARHTATVKTTEPLTAYVLRKNDIIKLLKDHPNVLVTLQMALGQAMYEIGHELGRDHIRETRGEFLASVRDEHLRQKKLERDALELLAAKRRGLNVDVSRTQSGKLKLGINVMNRFVARMPSVAFLGVKSDKDKQTQRLPPSLLPMVLSSARMADGLGGGVNGTTGVGCDSKTSSGTAAATSITSRISRTPSESAKSNAGDSGDNGDSSVGSSPAKKNPSKWDKIKKGGEKDQIRQMKSMKLQENRYQNPWAYVMDVATRKGKTAPAPPPKVSKWAVVRRAIREAKISAEISSLADEALAVAAAAAATVPEGEAGAGAPPGSKEQQRAQAKAQAQLLLSKRNKRSYFAQAMKAKLKVKVDYLLRDERLFYDTDEEKDIDEVNELSYYMGPASSQKRTTFRGHGTGRFGTAAPAQLLKSLSQLKHRGMVRAHRSCSDLIKIASPQGPSGEGDEGTDSDAAATAVSPGGSLSHSAMIHSEPIVTANDIRPRRQSWPSLDNTSWKREKKATSVV